MTEEINPIANLGNGYYAFDCGYCQGSGEMARDHDGRAPYAECEVCKGRGTVVVSIAGSEPFLKCKTCKGSGQVSRDHDHRAPYVACSRCSGAGVQPRLGTLSLIEPPPPILIQQLTAPTQQKKSISALPSVFLVHGRDHRIRDQIDLYLTKDLGLKTEVMQAGAHAGRTLPEKFEEIASTCSFAVFLLTADDYMQDLKTKATLKRARQNVILEVGYFWGALGRRNRVAFLVEGDTLMELPSDLQGIGWIPITADLAETKIRLQEELRAAGLV